MIVFAEPMFLAAAAGAALVGGWLVRRAHLAVARVSSVKLWAGLSGAEQRAGRRVRWELLCILLAAIVAGTAMAKPRWESPQAAPPRPPHVEWAMRSAAEKENSAELFVRVADAGKLPQRLSVEYFGNTDPDQVPAGVGLTTAGEPLESGDAERGAILHPPVGASDPHFWARLWMGRWVVSTVKFTPAASGGIRVVMRGKGDAALEKLLKIFPTGEGEVLVADEGEVDVEQIENGGVVLALPGAKVQGVAITGEKEVAQGAEIAAVNVPPFVNFRNARIQRYAEATLSPEWKVLARVQGSPLLAERPFERGVKVLWMGVYPAQTAWAADESFVLFFSDYIAKNFPIGESNGIVEWKAEVTVPSPTTNEPIALTQPFALAALAFLAAGMAGLVWREKR